MAFFNDYVLKWIILAIVLLTPLVFCPWSYGGSELPKLLFVHILIVFALVCLLLAKRKESTFKVSVIHLLLLAFLGISAIATALSVSPLISVTGTYQRYNGLILIADMILLCFLSASASLDLRKLFVSATVVGVILSLYGIAQHFGLEFANWDISEATRKSALKYRSFATLANPSFLGLQLAMILPLTMAGILRAGKRLKLAWYLALGLIIICLIFTYSRAGWLGAIAGLTAWIGLSYRKNTHLKALVLRWELLVVICSVIIGALLASFGDRPSVLDRAVSIASQDDSSTQVRFKLWRGSLDMIAERPILGWGPGTFRYVFPRFAPDLMNELERQNVSAHNDFLDHLTQIGVLGSAVYLCLLVVIFVIFFRVFYVTDDRSSISALGASLLSYLIAVQFGFGSLAPMSLWWILLGCLMGNYQCRSYKLPSWLAKAFISIITVIWIFLTLWSASWLIADVYFRDAKMAWENGDKSTAIAKVEQAIKWNPKQDIYLAFLGRIQQEMGNSSLEACIKAVWVNPINSANHALLATSLQSLGQDKIALKEWQKTIELDPQWVQAYNSLGLLYQKLGDANSAISSLMTAVDIEPDYASAHNNLGNVYLSKGEIDKAIISYQRALSLAPGWATAKHNMDIALRLRQEKK
jgi:O-antigen ligase/Flp pilus assembly protein TadD